MNEPVIKNAANEDELKEAKTKVKANQQSDRNVIVHLLKQKEFRRFIYEYVTRCDRISARDSGSWTYFAEGERNICQKIKASLIEADPEGVLLMMREGKDDFK